MAHSKLSKVCEPLPGRSPRRLCRIRYRKPRIGPFFISFSRYLSGYPFPFRVITLARPLTNSKEMATATEAKFHKAPPSTRTSVQLRRVGPLLEQKTWQTTAQGATPRFSPSFIEVSRVTVWQIAEGT